MPIDQFKGDLEQHKSMIKEVLPAHMPVERFTRAAVVAATTNPDILLADKQSLFMSLQKCAIDGLMPDNKEAALIVFSTKSGRDQWVKKVQYMPMVDGVLKRARQSGEIATITARAVHQNDRFEYWVDEDGEHLNHVPNFMEDRGAMKLVYAIAKLKSGETMVEPMSMEDVDRVRQSSKTPDKGPWKDWFDRMALKSALHRLARRLPNSSEIMEMLDAGNVMYDFKQERDVTPRRATSLAAKLAKPEVEEQPKPVAVEDLLTELYSLKSDHELAAWTVKAAAYEEGSEERQTLTQMYREHRANLKHAEEEQNSESN
jgi:recombination protein RecT